MIIYDIEVFKSDWILVALDLFKKKKHVIINNQEELETFYEKNKDNIFIGYNSRNYDQWILRALLAGFDPKEMSDFIILQKRKGWEFFKNLNKITINNFDISDNFKSLKELEAHMGQKIKESQISFNIDRKLTSDEINEIVEYCTHDVEQTLNVFLHRMDEFETHLQLLEVFDLPLFYINKTKAQLASIILNANKRERNDEFDINFPHTLIIKKYKEVLNWYKENKDYKKKLKIDIAGVPHIFAWGGLHGAIKNYVGEGKYLSIDVQSYYPALMIEYDFLSRNIVNPKKYKEIRDERLKLKKKKDEKHKVYKLILNSTYGAMKDKYNALYDPRQANNVCVGGQLLLLDLIEKLEGYCDLIQSNTDGLIIKYEEENYDEIISICNEWEKRTRMKLEFDKFNKIFQKDVNNYVIINEKGEYKSKGAYVKEWDNLDYDLVIIREAILNYFLKNIHPSKTINNCNELRKFQKIVKISNKYKYAMKDGETLKEKVFRIFASKDEKDGALYKVKEGKNPEKFANTPENCYIDNGNVLNIDIPEKLNKNWYIDLAKKRINDFKEGLI